MAYIATSARYGTGVFSVAEYGVTAISVTVTGVSTSVAVSPVQVGGLEVDITERVDTGVSTEGNIGTVEVRIKEEVQAADTVSANGAIGTVIPHAASKIVPDAVSTEVSIGDVEPQVKEEVNLSVSAEVAIGTVEVQITEKLTSVSADVNIGTVTLKVNSLARPDGDAATEVAIGDLEPQVQEPLDISLAADVGFNGDSIKLNITEFVPAVSANAALGDVTVTATQFNFENVKTLYSRRRTVIISRAA